MLRELFDSKRDIVINTDIDGFLCGALLQRCYGCRVVGFSNSRDTVWLSPDAGSLYGPVYVDLYVSHPDVFCIDQHIIAYDLDHLALIKSYGTKINPNIDKPRAFKSGFFSKYPFGTVHYLLALMAQDGESADIFGSLDRQLSIIIRGLTITFTLGHVLMRADDALTSTLSRYRRNAWQWWRWLDPQGRNPAIRRIVEWMRGLSEAKAMEYKRDMTRLFRALGCDGDDGAFYNVADNSGRLLPKVLEYNKMIEMVAGAPLSLPGKLIAHKGEYGCSMIRDIDASKLLSGNLYSYAFIYGPDSSRRNFSYTFNMK